MPDPRIAQQDQQTSHPQLAVKPVSPAATRALREAEERRQAYLEQEKKLPREIGGRGGNDPNRYGDWEVKGLTSDF